MLPSRRFFFLTAGVLVLPVWPVVSNLFGRVQYSVSSPFEVLMTFVVRRGRPTLKTDVMSGRKDETNDTLVHRFSTMVYVLLWPETMRKRECIGARERGRETNTHSSSSEGERHRC